MYYRARKIALSNNDNFHVVAFAKRKNGFIFGTNSGRCSARFARTYPNGSVEYHLHAEMDLIRKVPPGSISEIYVARFKKDGSMTMAKPCEYCQRFLKKHGVKKVNYTDWNGNQTSMIIK